MNESLLQKIRDNLIGEGQTLETPFGTRPLIYADYTASGRSLRFIEDYICDKVLPFYANTHTETSATGRQTTAFREQARQLIKQSVNASEEHLVIFCGSGATAAVNKMIDSLNMRLPAELNEQYRLDQHIPAEQRPVVFIGPYEHHSNELPWRESLADVISIPLNGKGQIDCTALENALLEYQDRPLKIGSFSAASNVTGILTDTHKISTLLHKHGALSCWDYAAGAPYMNINVSGTQENGDDSMDAAFISPHKFVGGPGTPGILVIKKSLFTNRVPATPGGGTVSYVTPLDHLYLPAGERREEGGTPAIVESIRAGLVFQLKDAVSSELIERQEHKRIQQMFERWGNNPNINILGSHDAERTAIVSFNILWQGRPLHYSFVVALLNDLFGIQSRGGCSCAGPYGHHLMGITYELGKKIEAAVSQGNGILKPGWVRMNFNYFIADETFEYLLRAVELIAEYGHRLLPHYQWDNNNGIWRYQGKSAAPAMPLDGLSYLDTKATIANNKSFDLQALLTEGQNLMEQAPEQTGYELVLPQIAEELRWFSLPCDQNK